MRSLLLLLCAAALVLLLVGSCVGVSPVASPFRGASFPAILYKAWANAYMNTEESRANITYISEGSSAGQRAVLTDRTAEYSATDSPLSEAQYAQVPDAQLYPMAASAVLPFYRLPPAFSQVNLVLTREVLVDIFIGNITRWNDPRIQSLNLVALPDAKISVVYRTDGSGTTNIFTTALSKFSRAWRFGSVNNWPAALVALGHLGGAGNEGVYSLVQSTENSIGYTSKSFIVNNAFLRNNYASIVNKAGRTVRADSVAVQAATEEAVFNNRFVADITDSANPSAWPIAGFTYILLRKQTSVNCDALRVGIDMLMWAQETYIGQYLTEFDGFAPFSASLTRELLSRLAADITCDGAPLSQRQVAWPVPKVDLDVL